MIRPPLEVADIVRTYGIAFAKQHRHWLTALHLKVLRAIVACRKRHSGDTSNSAIAADSGPSLTTRA